MDVNDQLKRFIKIIEFTFKPDGITDIIYTPQNI